MVVLRIWIVFLRLWLDLGDEIGFDRGRIFKIACMRAVDTH